jgi:hypothetical protein
LLAFNLIQRKALTLQPNLCLKQERIEEDTRSGSLVMPIITTGCPTIFQFPAAFSKHSCNIANHFDPAQHEASHWNTCDSLHTIIFKVCIVGSMT